MEFDMTVHNSISLCEFDSYERLSSSK